MKTVIAPPLRDAPHIGGVKSHHRLVDGMLESSYKDVQRDQTAAIYSVLVDGKRQRIWVSFCGLPNDRDGTEAKAIRRRVIALFRSE